MERFRGDAVGLAPVPQNDVLFETIKHWEVTQQKKRDVRSPTKMVLIPDKLRSRQGAAVLMDGLNANMLSPAGLQTAASNVAGSAKASPDLRVYLSSRVVHLMVLKLDVF